MPPILAVQRTHKNAPPGASSPKLLEEPVIRSTQAANQLVRDNQHLVRRFINTFTVGDGKNEITIRRLARELGIEQDLEQAVTMGLVVAAQRFDETMGTEFYTYAFYWMKKEALDLLRSENRVYVPRNSKSRNEATIRALELIDKNEGDGGAVDEADLQKLREKSSIAADIAIHILEKKGRVEAAKKRTKRTAVALQNARTTRSMQDPLGREDDDRTLADLMGKGSEEDTATTITSDQLHAQFLSVLERLSGIERMVLRACYEGKSMAELARSTSTHHSRRYGNEHISRERLRQIKVQALAKVRRLIGTESDRNPTTSALSSTIEEKEAYLTSQGIPAGS